MRAGAQINCECCDEEEEVLFLVDGNFDDDGMGGTQLAREWGAHLQDRFDQIGDGWQVVYYPDVKDLPGFSINNYAGIHTMIPTSFNVASAVAGLVAAGNWTPAGGFPRRVIIHGDAVGDSPAPYDYGTASADAINTFFGLIGGALAIGADSQDPEDWDIDATPFGSGVGTVVQQETSEVTGGTQVAECPSAPTRAMAHETVLSSGPGHQVSWVLAGTPSWLSSSDSNNVTFLENLHTVAV